VRRKSDATDATSPSGNAADPNTIVVASNSEENTGPEQMNEQTEILRMILTIQESRNKEL
jgi:hypothetical protein